MNFNKLIKYLLPKEDKFFVLLEQQARVLNKAALTLSEFTDSKVSIADVAKSVQDIEHEGDKLVCSLEEELNKTFVTPIDREDIHQLSTEIDDVIDFCNSAARVCMLYGVKAPSEPMANLMQLLVSCAKEINDTLPFLKKNDFEKLMSAKKTVKALEKEADTVYRTAVGNLFNSDIDYKAFIAEKSILEKLESAVDRCDDITTLFANLAIKHA